MASLGCGGWRVRELMITTGDDGAQWAEEIGGFEVIVDKREDAVLGRHLAFFYFSTSLFPDYG